jgi:hypothetical protein
VGVGDGVVEEPVVEEPGEDSDTVRSWRSLIYTIVQ